MGEPVSAYDAWAGLAAPWQQAIESAWESFRTGGIAVGAVLADASGAIISRGRNRRLGSGSARGLLAHAEMEALATLGPGGRRPADLVLYTTLHPCPMCLGAIVVARIGRFCFGAYDPTWLGIERLPQLNPEVQRRWPKVDGPLAGQLGEWLAILPCLNTNGSLVRAMQATAPQRAALARAVAQRWEGAGHIPETADRALAQVWDLLSFDRGAEAAEG